MIVRRHEVAGLASEARYSRCGTYRYLLSRRWGAGGSLLYILLNPSTATEEHNDPTVERCERRARALGYGGFAVTNLFAFRATRPEDLKRAGAPVGPGNDEAILTAAAAAERLICGWGVHGCHLGRGDAVAMRLRAAGHDLWHLGLTQAGEPRHPLYVAYAREPERWS
ncbi:DUF1643 domain-containing protein [Albidovulum sp.]|uniref:DUF1643 domain-containing protein n=1 Tax=Albidovulum sp. TaxID=1872424 RepID=UPI002C0DF72C|nr:DUF1643 domain-containing protein [Albidovulum sp.]